MFCIKCGHENLVAAKFCRKCGVQVEVEEETRVARRAVPTVARVANEDSPETEIFSISPTLMFVKVGYVLAAIAALLIVALFSAFTPTSVWIGVLLGLLLFLVPGFYHLRQKLVRYTLTDSMLEIDEGLVSRSTRSVPIRRIQDVTVSASVLQRLLGFGDLMIDNASDEGGKVVLKNINRPKECADVLLRQMRRLEN